MMIGRKKRGGLVAGGVGSPSSELGPSVLKALSPRLLVAALMTVLVSASMVGANLLAAVPAHAAVPAFDPGKAFVFISQDVPTQLYKGQSSGGNVAFEPVGAPRNVTYNAISYNTVDNFLYGVVNSGVVAIPRGTIIRIGSDGSIEPIGGAPLSDGARVGGFGPDGNLYVMQTRASTMTVIDTTDGRVVRTVALSRTLVTGDWSLSDGFLWGIQGATVYRVNPASGQVDSFSSPLPSGTYGAAWTYGNGNLGFLDNDTGEVFQVEVRNAAAAPTFTAFAAGSGPTSAVNDGAASPGRPTDLSITKTGPAALVPGATVTYTLKVENNGPSDSSGYIVSDKLPAPLTNARSDSSSCGVSGNDVECDGGPLPMGSSASFTVTADVPSNLNAAVTNTATLLGNEEDPNTSNNSATTTGLPARIGIEAGSGTPTDLNGNGITDAGDQIPLSYRITNGGQLPLTDIRAEDPKLDTISCPVTALPAGGSTTCTATYTVTTADVATGAAVNTVTAIGATPSGTTVTSTASTTTPLTEPAPKLGLQQSADVTTVAAPGDRVTYSFTVRNTGNVPIADVGVTSSRGQGSSSAITCPAGTLAVGASVICTSIYTTTQADIDQGSIDSTAVADGTAVGGDAVRSASASTEVSAQQSPALAIVKSAKPIKTAAPGSKVTYSFVATNTGNVTLTNVRIQETAFSGKGNEPVADCPAANARTLAPGASITCTTTYSLVQADIDAGEISNTAVASADPPRSVSTGEVTSQPSSVVLPMSQRPSLTLSKITTSAPITRAGQEVTFSFHVVNPGNVTITEPRITNSAFSGTGQLGVIVCPDGPVLPGQQVECTATYTVTQADVKAKKLSFTTSVTGIASDGTRTDPSRPFVSTINTRVDTATGSAPAASGGTDSAPAAAGAKAADGSRALAFTGTDLRMPIGIAVLLLLAGVLTYVTERYRRERL